MHPSYHDNVLLMVEEDQHDQLKNILKMLRKLDIHGVTFIFNSVYKEVMEKHKKVSPNTIVIDLLIYY